MSFAEGLREVRSGAEVRSRAEVLFRAKVLSQAAVLFQAKVLFETAVLSERTFMRLFDRRSEEPHAPAMLARGLPLPGVSSPHLTNVS